MTEKRFINDIDYGQLIDTKGELSTIDYSDKVDFYELWEFLNKLADENEQLKQFKEQHIEEYLKLKTVSNELKKENEKLKFENENLKITINARDTLIEVCEKKFRELGFIITVDDDGYVIE